jgi:chaperone protein EcpD
MNEVRLKAMRVLMAALLIVAALPVDAAVVITGTRVVYPEGSREENVRLSNIGKRPALVQAWIDDGRAGASPSDVKVPFMLMPPVFRIEPDKGQTLRVMYTGDALPADRESVFWLNVLEIPPKPEGANDRNLLQVAFRTRIKLFYRPTVLEGDPSSVREQIKWSVARDASGSAVLRAENPSPYYISLTDVSLVSADRTQGLDPAMAAPFAHVDFNPPKGGLALGAHPSVTYSVINDYGSPVKTSAPVRE